VAPAAKRSAASTRCDCATIFTGTCGVSPKTAQPQVG
jgi:hypothetical protein